MWLQLAEVSQQSGRKAFNGVRPRLKLKATNVEGHSLAPVVLILSATIRHFMFDFTSAPRSFISSQVNLFILKDVDGVYF